MKKTALFVLLVSLFFQITAQTKNESKTVRITYQNSFNNKIDSTSYTVMDISENYARIQTVMPRREANEPIQITYLDYVNNKETKTAQLANNEFVYTNRTFKLNDGLTPLPKTEEIAGYNCKKVKTIINSNTLEVWYTTQLGVKGSMQPAVAIPDGVVMKVVRNGQRAEIAVKVELPEEDTNLQPTLSGKELTAPAYNYRIQQSKVITVNVFNKESIYFRDIPKQTKLDDTKVMRFANGSIILKKVKLPENNAGYSIFAEMSQYSEGDAYDRTGSVFIVPTNNTQSFLDGLLHGKDKLPQYTDIHGGSYEGMTVTDTFTPPLELMRFYTSFGVRGYNHIQVADYIWPDSVVYKQEITDYAKVLTGEVWIGTWIGNYSENGHNVTLDIKYYPRGNKDKAAKEVYPIFTTVNIMEMAGQVYPEAMFRDDSLTVTFNTDTDIKNAYIRYITTGHGGWGGGDEFNPKLNEVFLNSNRLIAYTPWREDCKSYRELNPASGNFATGLSSSDLSRSGWCPGMVSYPIYIHVGDLEAGQHQIQVAIPVGDPEGSSRSYWCISGALVGDK